MLYEDNREGRGGPQKGEDVLSEIANGNYGFLSINAEMTLKEWKEGRLKFLFISN